MTTDKLICAIESVKYEGAIFVVCEEYIMESTSGVDRSSKVGGGMIFDFKKNTENGRERSDRAALPR